MNLMALDVAQTLGWLATFLFSVMIVPQIIKTVRLKDTSGVSLMFFIIYLVANIIAIVYAFMINQPPLIIKYSIAIGTSVFYIGLFFYYKYRTKRQASSSD